MSPAVWTATANVVQCSSEDCVHKLVNGRCAHIREHSVQVGSLHSTSLRNRAVIAEAKKGYGDEEKAPGSQSFSHVRRRWELESSDAIH